MLESSQLSTVVTTSIDGPPVEHRRPVFNEGIGRFEELVSNALLARKEFFNSFMDPRRDIDKECGYPALSQVSAARLRDLYDREPIATRVVQVLPKECWQVTPEVYEDEDAENVTQFEEAWDNLGRSLRGRNWYQDEEGSPVWDYLCRADIVSGIGYFGVVLLGIDDGKELSEPVEGVEEAFLKGYEPPEPTAKAGDPQQGKPYAPGQRPAHATEPPRRPSGANGKPLNGASAPNGRLAPNGKPNGVLPARVTAPPPGEEEEEDPEFEPDEFEDDIDFDDEPMTEEEQLMDGKRISSAFKPKNRLLYMRVLDESLIDVSEYETDKTSPRYGQPVVYNLTINDPREQHSGLGATTNQVPVHWTRVLHVADNLDSSEVFGVPRLRPVLNRILDLVKLYGGSAEMYWRGAFPGLSLETHPQLGGDVSIDRAGIRNQMEQYSNGLQRYLALMGMAAKTLAPTVVDPTAQIEVQITAICIQIGSPKRVFMGSERGELASSQDDSSWNDRKRERQTGYITPRIICPFIDRMIMMGILPEPVGYSVKWPDPDALTGAEKADIALKVTQALAAYVGGGLEAVMELMDYFTRILGFTEEEAQSIIDAKEQVIADEAALGLQPGEDQYTPDPNAMQQQELDLKQQQFDAISDDPDAVAESMKPQAPGVPPPGLPPQSGPPKNGQPPQAPPQPLKGPPKKKVPPSFVRR